MGALVNTFGTQVLLRILNTEFKDHIGVHRNQNVQSGPWAGTPIKDHFNPANGHAVSDLVNNIRHSHGGPGDTMKCFLPRDSNLAARWMLFLTTASYFDPSNNAPLLSQIYLGLTDTYGYLQFDCVDSDAASGTRDAQHILSSNENEYNAAGHLVNTYLKIVLVTKPMGGTIWQAPAAAKSGSS